MPILVQMRRRQMVHMISMACSRISLREEELIYTSWPQAWQKLPVVLPGTLLLPVVLRVMIICRFPVFPETLRPFPLGDRPGVHRRGGLLNTLDG